MTLGKSKWMIAALLLATMATTRPLSAQDHPNDKAKHNQYKLYDLGTFGGPNATTSFFATSLTSKGAIGGAQTAAHDPFDPNCLGDLTGLGCSVLHAFHWERGVLTDLGALPGNNGNNGSWSFFINNKGLISGISENGSIDSSTGYPETHAVVWDKGKITDLGTFGGTQSSGTALNERGQVIGWAMNTTDDPYSAAFESISVAGTWPGTTQVRAFVWEKGVKWDLGTLGGPDALAYAINQRGQIAGYSYTNYTPNPDTGIPTVDPFLWEKGKMTDLGTLGGTIGYPLWLNNRGQVVGISNLADNQLFHGFLWDRGVLRDLPPVSGGSFSYALWINDAGDVVGGSSIAGDQLFHAPLWRHGKAMDLGTVGQDACSEAYGINGGRQIVGVSYPCSSFQDGRAFLWENGGPMIDLNALVENPSDLHVYWGTYISESGEIVAQGTLPNGDIHVAVLVPHGDCNEDCEQRIVVSQNAPAVPANTGSTIPAFGKPANWLHNPFGQRNAMPGQRRFPRE